MVRAFGYQPSMQKSRSFHFKRMFELPGRHAHSLILESGHTNQGSRTAGESTSNYRPIGWSLNINTDKVSSLAENIKIKPRPPSRPTSDTEMMKEKFAKLLLGEDMSGGGKGASSALALSNAITNLSGSLLFLLNWIVHFLFVEREGKSGRYSLKNRVEASIVIWKRKLHHKDGKHSWSSSVSLEKRELFEERAEAILLLLKQKFPGISQSALDISKIQYNKDVGYSILESYSRIIESLAFNIISRIEDVLHADSLIDRSPSAENFTSKDSVQSSPKANAMGDDNSKLAAI